jgi:hypothetical protein
MVGHYFRVASPSFWDLINRQFDMKGGVYVLVCKEPAGVGHIPVQRFLGIDKQGVLYIGKADCFFDRVIALKKSISPEYKSSSHECGIRYKANPKIQELFPFENLLIGLKEDEDPRALELKMLENYVSRFGEVPPLNAIL